jgi:hypothetical protein
VVRNCGDYERTRNKAGRRSWFPACSHNFSHDITWHYLGTCTRGGTSHEPATSHEPRAMSQLSQLPIVGLVTDRTSRTNEQPGSEQHRDCGLPSGRAWVWIHARTCTSHRYMAMTAISPLLGVARRQRSGVNIVNPSDYDLRKRESAAQSLLVARCSAICARLGDRRTACLPASCLPPACAHFQKPIAPVPASRRFPPVINLLLCKHSTCRPPTPSPPTALLTFSLIPTHARCPFVCPHPSHPLPLPRTPYLVSSGRTAP